MERILMLAAMKPKTKTGHCNGTASGARARAAESSDAGGVTGDKRIAGSRPEADNGHNRF
jgi:hypothetical protein